MNLTADLSHIAEEIAGYARDEGLDFYRTLFEMLDYEQMNEVASLGGFPTRYPHWRFGMEFDYMKKSYSYGLHKIYEMVINNDPCYAYLLNCNNLVDQKLVMAHVYAHCDFFKNNLFFAHTNRKMIDETANHGARIRRHSDRHGFDEVEEFLDCCLSVDNLIDIHSVAIQRREPKRRVAPGEEDEKKSFASRFEAQKGYMEDYINPPDLIASQETSRQEEEEEKKKRFPEENELDVLLFLIEHAPLENWQRDVLSIIREEAYYFAPQAQTKIMNEGWATYWHSKIMTGKALTDAEIIDFADHHSGTVHTQPNQLNPYKLGVELFRDIEDRWNRGRFGRKYEECEDRQARRNWDTGLGKGREKIFEVRRIFNDISFIDTFLTPEFCREQKLFVYAHNDRSGMVEIADRDFPAIKQQILNQLTNAGSPFIYVEDGNYRNRGELLLRHRHEGTGLRMDYAESVLKNLNRIWSRPVHLATVFDGQECLIGFDGDDFQMGNCE